MIGQSAAQGELRRSCLPLNSVLQYFTSQNLKRLVGVVLGGEVAAKDEVLFRLRGSEPKDLSQVGNHA